jgi:hypothetical protein
MKGRPTRMVLFKVAHSCIFYIKKYNVRFNFIFPLWLCGPTLARASSVFWFLDNTQLRTKPGRAPLDEWWAHRRDDFVGNHPPLQHVKTTQGQKPCHHCADTDNHKKRKKLNSNTTRPTLWQDTEQYWLKKNKWTNPAATNNTSIFLILIHSYP